MPYIRVYTMISCICSSGIDKTDQWWKKHQNSGYFWGQGQELVGKEYVCLFWGEDQVLCPAMILNYMVYTLLKLSENTFKTVHLHINFISKEYCQQKCLVNIVL